MKNKIQLDATYYVIMLMLGSTCFGHHYAHHQELTKIELVTTNGKLLQSLGPVVPETSLSLSLSLYIYIYI